MHHLESEIDRGQITIKDLGFANVEHEKEGRPPYHPKVLVKL